ncbi:MAG TPA: NAD-dependent protein deacylase, partial [Clostridia bacterium]|nr:NAD-dependent protein deacylase [Clostridia bacterium]
MQGLETLRAWVKESRGMVFFGGAGVSTESGIPDFRSADGLYSRKMDVSPEVLLSHRYFMKHPEAFFRFYRDFMTAKGVQPNAAHRTLAAWEAQGRLRAIITQNIDGLHQAAGSTNVLELHGSIHRNHCMQCARAFGLEAILTDAPVPRCPCGGIIKPDVVLYEESLPEAAWEGSVRALSEADLLIVGGTSLTVYPAAGLIDAFCGKRLV